jgi:hypothetical protein
MATDKGLKIREVAVTELVPGSTNFLFESGLTLCLQHKTYTGEGRQEIPMYIWSALSSSTQGYVAYAVRAGMLEKICDQLKVAGYDIIAGERPAKPDESDHPACRILPSEGKPIAEITEDVRQACSDWLKRFGAKPIKRTKGQANFGAEL